jgi:hypothetical protein
VNNKLFNLTKFLNIKTKSVLTECLNLFKKLYIIEIFTVNLYIFSIHIRLIMRNMTVLMTTSTYIYFLFGQSMASVAFYTPSMNCLMNTENKFLFFTKLCYGTLYCSKKESVYLNLGVTFPSIPKYFIELTYLYHF